MEKTPVIPLPPPFQVPADLLKAFKSDLRFLPINRPVAGYIVFDRQMLKSILLNEDAKVRREFADQLDKVHAAGGELVLMAPQAG